MIEIEEMTSVESGRLLHRVGYGHLACCRSNQPYVVPIHYAYDEPTLYIYTTEGKKAEIIRVNPQICLQVEDVEDNENWMSVIVTGDAEQLFDEKERDTAMRFLTAVNPTMTPAVSIRWMDNWVRENVEVIYRITPRTITGRKTVDRSHTDATLAPPEKEKRSSIY